MSNGPKPEPIPPPEAGEHDNLIYEIRLKGHLDSRWSDWFDGLTIQPQRDSTTLLVGPVRDQAALHGLLAKVRDLGLPLLAVACKVPDE